MRYLSFATSLALLTAIGCQRAADQKPAPAAAPPVKTVPVAAKPLAEQFADFKREHHEREQKFYSQLSADRNDNEKINQANKDWQQFAMQHAAKLKALIKTNAGDPAAFDGLLVLVGELRYPLDEDLIKLVNEKFLAEPRMGQLCFDLRQRGSEQWPEAILQAATKHALREVRGQAEFALGDYYRSKALPYGRPLPEAEQDKWLAEAAKHYTIALTDYSSATTP